MKYSTDILRQGVELRLAGMKPEEVRAVTGIKNHSALELAEKAFAWAMTGSGQIPLTPENVAALRDVFQLGWGNIMVMCATDEQVANLRAASETKVRNAYSEWTNIDHRGLRVGRGGRFLNGDPVLYADELAATGTPIPAGQARNVQVARESAMIAKMAKLPFSELKALAKEHGIRVTKTMTPSQIARRIAKKA